MATLIGGKSQRTEGSGGRIGAIVAGAGIVLITVLSVGGILSALGLPALLAFPFALAAALPLVLSLARWGEEEVTEP